MPAHDFVRPRKFPLVLRAGPSGRRTGGVVPGGSTGSGLNRAGTGQPWSRGRVRQVLCNEKYIGNNVYNRVSFKLKKRRVANPPAMWVRAD
jgi:hypothetical protein